MNKNLPGWVSVIIPTYKRAGMITRVLDSVWNQTYRPIELLVVNDGSPDNTEEVVSEWIAKHSETAGFSAKLITQPNAGGCAARNNGLRNAIGEFIQFFDDDDELLPEALTNHVNNLKMHPYMHASLSQAIYVSARGTAFTHYNPKFFGGLVSILKDLPSPSFILFRQEFLGKRHLEWNTSLPCGQDTDFMVMCLLNGLTISVIHDFCCCIYFHSGQRVTQKLSDVVFEQNKHLFDNWLAVGRQCRIDENVFREAFSVFFFQWLKESTLKGNLEEYKRYVQLASEVGCAGNTYVCLAVKYKCPMFWFRIFLWVNNIKAKILVCLNYLKDRKLRYMFQNMHLH